MEILAGFVIAVLTFTFAISIFTPYGRATAKKQFSDMFDSIDEAFMWLRPTDWQETLYAERQAKETLQPIWSLVYHLMQRNFPEEIIYYVVMRRKNVMDILETIADEYDDFDEYTIMNICKRFNISWQKALSEYHVSGDVLVVDEDDSSARFENEYGVTITDDVRQFARDTTDALMNSIVYDEHGDFDERMSGDQWTARFVYGVTNGFPEGYEHLSDNTNDADDSGYYSDDDASPKRKNS